MASVSPPLCLSSGYDVRGSLRSEERIGSDRITRLSTEKSTQHNAEKREENGREERRREEERTGADCAAATCCAAASCWSSVMLYGRIDMASLELD